MSDRRRPPRIISVTANQEAVMSKKLRETVPEAKRQREMEDESEAATQAEAKRVPPNEVSEKALMHRQSKKMHRQDGK